MHPFSKLELPLVPADHHLVVELAMADLALVMLSLTSHNLLVGNARDVTFLCCYS